MKYPRIPLLLLALLGFLPAAKADPISVEGATYAVECDAKTGVFSIRHKPSGTTFLRNATAGEGQGTASLSTIDDPRFGRMPGIRVTRPDGTVGTIALPEKLPFVLLSSVMTNRGDKDVVLNRVPGLSAAVDLGKPAGELKSLGTGGLLQPDQNPGSYGFLALADPSTLRGVVAGWVSQDRSSGVVFSSVADGGLRLSARSDYGHLLIKPGASAGGETLALGYFDDTREGLERYGDVLAQVNGVKLKPHKPGHCTWYMDKHARACDEQHLPELAAFADKMLKPYGFDFLQIDDYWQSGSTRNGPRRNFMEHNPQGPYPSGMKATATMIAGHGLTPGLWFIPFGGTWSDPFFRAHPEWFVKDENGRPYEVKWGGTCLDMTSTGARDYLKGLVTRVTKDWGYRFLKLDGFWTGSATKLTYINNGYVEDGMGDAVFSDPGKPNIEAMRDGVKLVREAAGPDVFLLGCCLSQNMRSLAGSVGLVDAMRVGPDTGSGEIGAPHASRLWFLNGRVWWNDPDCVTVRAAVRPDQARMNASFAAVSGAMFLDSDWLPDLPPDRVDVLRRCMPLHDLPARPVDVLEREPAAVWHLPDTRREPRRDLVAFFNWEKIPANVTVTPEKAGLPPAKEYVAFDFWSGKFVPPFSGTFGGMLPGKSSRVLSVRPVSDHPQVLSTSRHITQGMVDMPVERWLESSSTLEASCDVVGGDADEIRIVVPTGGNSWVAGDVSLSKEDQQAGVKATLNQSGPRIRVTLTSPVSRTVRWSLPFKAGAVSCAPPVAVTGLTIQADHRGVRLEWNENGADRYRVTRGDGFVLETAQPRLNDTTPSNYGTLTYTVRALGWNGTEGTPASVTTRREIHRPKDPAKPHVLLETLKPVSQPQSPVVGHSVTVEGRAYPGAIGVRSPSTLVYTIPAGATRFVAAVGLDDATPASDQTAVIAEVQGDVKEMGEKPQSLGESPVLRKGSIRSWVFDLPVDPRYKEIRLIVRPDAKDTRKERPEVIDWADAGFLTGK